MDKLIHMRFIDITRSWVSSISESNTKMFTHDNRYQYLIEKECVFLPFYAFQNFIETPGR